MAKVLPLLEKLKTNCQQFDMFHKNLIIDESMVPYRGLHSAKQFIIWNQWNLNIKCGCCVALTVFRTTFQVLVFTWISKSFASDILQKKLRRNTIWIWGMSMCWCGFRGKCTAWGQAI